MRPTTIRRGPRSTLAAASVLAFAVAMPACTGISDTPPPLEATDGGEPAADALIADAAAPPEAGAPADAGASAEAGASPEAAPPPADATAPPADVLLPPDPPADGPRDQAPPPVVVDAGAGERFSFFVTSLEMIRELSGSPNGFGGNLGGLAGADQICQKIAARVGAGHKTWRAFLSATRGPAGAPVHAIERIGEGPWYDRNGRLIAMNRQGLLGERPMADPQARDDLPNERGEGQKRFGDNHDILTGSNRMGRAVSADPATTCQDWTSAAGPGTGGKVFCGHSWPRSSTSGRHWISEHTVRGCAPGVNLTNNGAGTGDCVGCGGGYGGLYCFALTP